MSPVPIRGLAGCGGRAALCLPSCLTKAKGFSALPVPIAVGQLQLATGKAVPGLWGKEGPKRAGSVLLLRFSYRR